MLAGGRRLPRLACALGQRRHYLRVALHGGDGSEPIALKLSAPWGKSSPPLAKPFEEVANPIMRDRVLTPLASSFFTNSRVIITMAEESAGTASMELLPKPIEAEAESEAESDEEDEWDDEEEEEWDAVYPTVKVKRSSGDVLMDKIHQGADTAEYEDDAEEAGELTRSSPSFVIDLCIWPGALFANATIHEQVSRSWRSSWSFNMETDSEEMSDSLQLQRLALFDQPVEYRGVVCGSFLDKFEICMDTHYDLKEMLGSGADGQVYRCESLENPQNNCAIKCSTYGKLIIKEQRESQIMKKLYHPNVTRFFCAWKEQRGGLACNSVFIALELCKCTLEDQLDKAPVMALGDRIKIFVGVVSGVNYLHAHGIVHRDIKCNNIFLDDQGSAKIGDFGHSGLTSSHSCCYGGKFYGTKLYCAPELVQMKRHGVKSDIFSLGMVYAELFGPANVASERLEWLLKLSKLINSRQWKRNPLSTWGKSELSKDFTGDVYLMINMLKWSPKERPSCAEILEALAQGASKP